MNRSVSTLLLISAAFYISDVPWLSGSHHALAERNRTFNRELVSVRAQDVIPKVSIEIPGAPQSVTWNEQLRYMISVSDPTDGHSKYGEIDARACLMEIEYFPEGQQAKVNEALKVGGEPIGLTLMRRSTCFGCHADKTRLAGPSFAEIAARYENNPGTLRELGSHVINGSSGTWGSQIMPSHPDVTPEQATQIVAYILDQGRNRNRWIYPGLEGAFRTIEKGANESEGTYVLTASYNSTSNVRGAHSVVLKIK